MSSVKTAKIVKTNLQGVRKAAGFQSARAFAEHFGISVNTYTGYEQGKPMSLETAWAFADALNCSLDELAGRSVKEKRSSKPDEAQLIDAYRKCTKREQNALLNMAETMADDGMAKNSEVQTKKAVNA